MATSSLFDNIRINNPKFTEAYVEALEKAEREPVHPLPQPSYEEVTDPDAIRDILTRGIENWVKKP